MRKIVKIFIFLFVILIVTTAVVSAGGNSRRQGIILSADRTVELQRTDADWEGTWYWYVGSTGNATNLTGATALGLLEAYNDTHDEAYLNSALGAADFIQTHLGAEATGTPHWPRLTAPDVVFLHRLSQVTGDPNYSTRADLEWLNLTASYPTAGDLDALFRAIPRPSAWDIAFFLEAAYLSGDSTWADDAAAILVDTADKFYYGGTWWYALNVAGAVRALVDAGYAEQYNDEIVVLLTMLEGVVSEDNGVDGYIQDTAYAVLAFANVGGNGRRYSNDLGRWLAQQQDANGGWIEAGDEYPEINGESLRALASTIGSDVTLDGFASGTRGDFISSWNRSANTEAAIPFSGD